MILFRVSSEIITAYCEETQFETDLVNQVEESRFQI